MSVLFLHTTPPPVFDHTDAVHQEVGSLEKMIEGEVIFLNPWKIPNRIFPRALLGWHLLPILRKLELKTQLNHVFSPTLYFFPILSRLNNPIIFNISASLNREGKPANIDRLATLHKIIVSNERDKRIMQEWGLDNYQLVRTGIDTSHIHPHSLPVEDEFGILMASSPWVRSQFNSKGIDLLLRAAKALPFLKLILLWRGPMEKRIHRRIREMDLEKRVQVINRHVNIPDFLNQVHATVLLAKTPEIVKAYPHSLIESLAAGKPIIASESIPIADYIRETGCGLVLNYWNENELKSLIIQMKIAYSRYQSTSLKILAKDFSHKVMLEQIGDIYKQILGN